MTYDEYRASMTRNQERFDNNEKNLQLSDEDLAAFKNLSKPLHVIAIAEDWCGDVIDNLPILGRIAKESGTLDVRVFPRDQNLDLMEQYLNQGKFQSIPAIIFFDEDFNEIGRFIERPDSVSERRTAHRKELFEKNPAFGPPGTPPTQLPEDVRVQLTEALAENRAGTKVQDNSEVVRDLRAIVEKA